MMSMVETTAVEFRAEYSRAKLVIGKSDEEENPSASPTPEASTESSSIGQPDDEEDEDEDEVQSTLSSLGSLEDSLPIKRGLSKFYTGKSKSFANVTEVRNVKELGKSENPFNKRRRSLMAYNLMFKEDKNNNSKKKKSFYSHSNHISMPLLPLAEDEDESSDAEEYYAPTASFRLHQIKEHRPYHTSGSVNDNVNVGSCSSSSATAPVCDDNRYWHR